MEWAGRAYLTFDSLFQSFLWNQPGMQTRKERAEISISDPGADRPLP